MRRYLNGVRWLAIGVLFCGEGCSGEPLPPLAENKVPDDVRLQPPSSPPADSVATETTTDHAFDNDLLKVAADYTSWGRVDDFKRWAPETCNTTYPARAHASASTDDVTHGRKLYSLFAREHNEYLHVTAVATAAVGLVVVKQSWIPEEITDEAERPKKDPPFTIDFTKVITTPAPGSDAAKEHGEEKTDRFYPYAEKDGKVFKASKQADLFIMMKLDPTTPGTDAGWVYGTVTPDGKTVTSAGKVATCMKCHLDATGDHLFGLPEYRMGAAIREINRLGGDDAITAHFDDVSGWQVDAVALNKKQGNRATDGHLLLLKELAGLKTLRLEHSQVTDAGMDHLAGLVDLEELGLADTLVGDAGVAKLARLNHLQNLELGDTQLTDVGLAHLKELVGLKKVSLVNTRVTAAGVAELQRALSDVSVEK